MYPPTWERFWPAVAGALAAEVAREVFDDLVCESGRVLFFELAMPWLDRAKAARVNFGAVAGPVPEIAGGAGWHAGPQPGIATRPMSRFPSPTTWFFTGTRYPSPWATSTTGSPGITCSPPPSVNATGTLSTPISWHTYDAVIRKVLCRSATRNS